ncbi:hypothetical protein PtB15_4B757 [Puccinia triticina]|nr:hypothetical protein PtB15_4B757 [Puccinia triticina]
MAWNSLLKCSGIYSQFCNACARELKCSKKYCALAKLEPGSCVLDPRKGRSSTTPESVDSPASGLPKVHIDPCLFDESAGIVSGSALPAAHSTATRPPRSQSFPVDNEGDYQMGALAPGLSFALDFCLSPQVLRKDALPTAHHFPLSSPSLVHPSLPSLLPDCKGFSTTQDTVAFISRLYLPFNQQPGTVDIPYYQ